MADAFSSELTDVAAPKGADSFGQASLQRPQRDDSDLALAVDLASTIFSGALAISEQKRTRGLSKGVDTAIDEALASVVKLKEASGQNVNLTNAFNLNLAAKVKELKTKFDPDEVNKVLISRGLTPPRAAIFDELAQEEQREEVAQAARVEDAIDEAFEQGVAVTDENGVIDREATVALMQTEARAAAVQADIMANLGLFQKPSGEIGETARLAYFQKRPTLRNAVFQQIMVGLRIPLNKLNTMLRVATPSDIGEVKKQMLDVVALADRFRLEQVTNSIDLNKPEQDDHMAFVDTLILSVTGGILELQDAKDLNTMKALASTMDWANRNIDIINIEDFPVLSRVSRMSKEMGAVMLSIGLSATGLRARLQREVSKELGAFTEKKPPIEDMLPPPNPKPSDLPELGADEAKHSAVDQKKRIQFSIDVQADFQDKNIIVQKKPDAYAWLQLQGPLFNARNDLSVADKVVLAEQMTSPNYLQNLEASLAFFNDKASAVGSYAFDVVQQDLQNNVRELRNVGGFGRLGRDFEIVFDDLSKKFIVRDTKEFKESALAVEEGLGTPAGGTFADIPSVKKRLEKINRDVSFMLKTRDFKDTLKGISELDFMEDITAFIVGDVTQIGVVEEVATPPQDIAIDFIAKLEGFAPVAKKSVKGDLPTKGFGNTRGVKVGDKVSREEALVNLGDNIQEAMIFIEQAVTVPLNENQRAALASLIFNVGKGAFGRSAALKALNAGDMKKFRFEVEDAKKGFVRLFEKGPVLPGLVKRRKKEMDLFFKEDA